MKFKVGDTVQFRSWDDMEKDLPIDSWGDLEVPKRGVYFLKTMRHLCGTSFTITKIENKEIHGHDTNWNICKEMLELVKSAESINTGGFNVGDTVQIKSLSELKASYGKPNGDIECGTQSFTSGMRDLCGKTFVIEKFKAPDIVIGLRCCGWVITKDMIRSLENKFNVEDIERAFKAGQESISAGVVIKQTWEEYKTNSL